MAEARRFGEVTVEDRGAYVWLVEMHRPPANFFDRALIASLADAFEALDREPACRALVLCSEGKHFCAGANLGRADPGIGGGPGGHLYDHAVRLFRTRKPVVAAVQGAAVGGGLGLALVADFRVASRGSRFSANFARLGFHHGFGLSATLPRAIGPQRALEMLYLGRRIPGDEAHRIGLCDRLVEDGATREAAIALAAEIATSGPLAIASIRETMRAGLADEVRRATEREKAEQERLQTTADFREGVAAMAERRTPRFTGQ